MKLHRATLSLLTLGLPAMALSDPPTDPGGASASSSPRGLVIQCPYIPEGVDPVPRCQGRRATCVGTEGDDLIWGTEDSEVIMGLGGDDVIHGDDGDDIVCAGPGNDGVHGARGDDFLFGEEGNDWLFGARGKDSLYGGPGERDILWGGPDLDYLDGGPGGRDVCIQQREVAKVDVETCEIVFPPPGYDHEKQHAYPPGIIWEAMPGWKQPKQ